MIETRHRRNNDNYALVLGLAPPGLSLLRELGRAGVPLCGVTPKDAWEVGRYSRYVNTLIEYLDGDDLLAKLMAFGRQMRQKPVLIPTSDRYIFFIADHHEQLSQAYTFQSSYRPETVASTVDKKYLYRSLKEHGIPYPTTWLFDDNADLSPERFRDYFPIIAKPRLIHRKKKVLGSRKVFVIRSSKDLETFCSNFGTELSEWVLQEIIPGPPSNLYLFVGYFNRQGLLMAQFTCQKIRQFPENFGVGTLLVSQPNRTVANLSERYLKAIEHHGICETEFKFDPRDRKFKMMEINPRPPLFAGLAASAGINLNLCAYRDLTGQRNSHNKDQIDGVVWKHFEFDLRQRVSSMFKTAAGKMSVARNAAVIDKKSVVGSTGPIWAGDDKRPSLFLPLYYLMRVNKLPRWIRSRSHGSTGLV